MLSLQLKSGDYFTIGEDITVQVFQTHNAALKVMLKAPRARFCVARYSNAPRHARTKSKTV